MQCWCTPVQIYWQLLIDGLMVAGWKNIAHPYNTPTMMQNPCVWCNGKQDIREVSLAKHLYHILCCTFHVSHSGIFLHNMYRYVQYFSTNRLEDEHAGMERHME